MTPARPDGAVPCWGISRELAHSPGRETDDAQILRLTGARLAALGFAVELKTTEEVAAAPARPPFVFLMCERPAILERLSTWERQGTVQVNRPSGVWNTYRDRLLARFEAAGLPFPRSLLVSTDGHGSDPRSVTAPEVPCWPLWVKRGDVHNTQEGDVVLAADPRTARDALATMAARGIGHAVLQQHVPGDLIKFYGVGTAPPPAGGPESDELPAPWFRWFYHRDQPLAGYAFAAETLQRIAQRAAAVLGLEVFGGDAIATADGRLVLIDLNAWPSFALYREEASMRIAAYLAARFRRVVDVA